MDLASDNIAEDDLTSNPSEAGSAADDSDTDGDESVTTDEGLPLIPRPRVRLSKLVASKECAMKHVCAAGLASAEQSTAPTSPPRRLACLALSQQVQRNLLNSALREYAHSA